MDQISVGSMTWSHLEKSEMLTQVKPLGANPVKTVLIPNSQVVNLRAVAPGAKRPTGVFVLSSHAEDIPPGFDIDLKLSLLSLGVLHKRRGGTVKTKKCGQTGSQQMHFYSS